MKIFIVMRDLLTWPREMAYTLWYQGHEVVLLDNASTYEPLLDWYSSCGYRVIRMRENLGGIYTAIMCDEIRNAREPYVLTDPDLAIEQVPADWPEVLAEGLSRWPLDSKCGLSLDETLIPSRNPAWKLDEFDQYPAGNHPHRWAPERAVMGSRCMYHPVWTDTTFALYRPGVHQKIDGHRAGRPYTARHLPWHLVSKLYKEDSLQIPLTDELLYYFEHARTNEQGAYSTTKTRLAKMLKKARRVKVR